MFSTHKGSVSEKKNVGSNSIFVYLLKCRKTFQTNNLLSEKVIHIQQKGHNGAIKKTFQIVSQYIETSVFGLRKAFETVGLKLLNKCFDYEMRDSAYNVSVVNLLDCKQYAYMNNDKMHYNKLIYGVS